MMIEQSIEERRQFRRVPYGAWVEDLSADRENLSFYLSRDLSQGGLLLSSAAGAPPPIGSPVRLRLVIENESEAVNIEGQVVRHDVDGMGAPLFAVQFEQLDPARGNFLQQLVVELTRRQLD